LRNKTHNKQKEWKCLISKQLRDILQKISDRKIDGKHAHTHICALSASGGQRSADTTNETQTTKNNNKIS